MRRVKDGSVIGSFEGINIWTLQDHFLKFHIFEVELPHILKVLPYLIKTSKLTIIATDSV